MATKAALVWKPQNIVAINDEQGEKLLRLIRRSTSTTTERLRQFRGVGRTDGEAERVRAPQR
jgi:hypothetical protein